MNITTFIGAAVVICLLLVVIKQYKPDMAMAATVATGVLLLGVIIADLAPALVSIKDMTQSAGISEYIVVVFKAFGICLVTHVASDLCRDAGQITIAERIDTAGKLAVLLVSMPMLAKVLSMSVGILGN